MVLYEELRVWRPCAQLGKLHELSRSGFRKLAIEGLGIFRRLAGKRSILEWISAPLERKLPNSDEDVDKMFNVVFRRLAIRDACSQRLGIVRECGTRHPNFTRLDYVFRNLFQFAYAQELCIRGSIREANNRKRRPIDNMPARSLQFLAEKIAELYLTLDHLPIALPAGYGE